MTDHYRRGTWATSKLGKRFWRRGGPVHRADGKSVSSESLGTPLTTESATARKSSGMTVAVTVAAAGIVATVTILSLPGGGASTGAPENVDNAASAEASAHTTSHIRQAEAALFANGYKVQLDTQFDSNCRKHSYGAVQNFFRADPCNWLVRTYFAVSLGGKGLTIVAVSWVDMPNIRSAKKYKHLVDRSGTGNITELSRDSGPYKNIHFNADIYSSGMIGRSVWNAEVQPVDPVATAVAYKILEDSKQ
jgi:hypothetical protein